MKIKPSFILACIYAVAASIMMVMSVGHIGKTFTVDSSYIFLVLGFLIAPYSVGMIVCSLLMRGK